MNQLVQFTTADELQDFCVILCDLGVTHTLIPNLGVVVGRNDLWRVRASKPAMSMWKSGHYAVKTLMRTNHRYPRPEGSSY